MTTMSRPRPATEKEVSQWAKDYDRTHPDSPRIDVPYVAEGQSGIVRRGNFVVACARSHTMAKRIANALNNYTPNEKGE